MALAILPQDRGSADPGAESADLLALTVELIESEQLTPFEAETQAVALIDDLSAYAAIWDADASLAGHPNAAPSLGTAPITAGMHLALLE